MVKPTPARRRRVGTLQLEKGRTRQRDRIQTQPWTPERESQVQSIIFKACGQSPQALAFNKAALMVMKQFTSPENGAGRKPPSARDNKETLRGLQKSITRTRTLMTKTGDNATLVRQFAEEWKRKEYRVKRWGSFTFPTPLLRELEEVAAAVKIRSARGTRAQDRRNYIVAELARMYEHCFGKPAERTARGEFGQLVRRLLPLCGFRTRLSDMLRTGFALFDQHPQVTYRIRIESRATESSAANK